MHKILSTNTGSDESFDAAAEWIDTCTRDHSLCTQLRNRPVSSPDTLWLPTRLLEVVSLGDGSDDMVYLREDLTSSDSQSIIDYATLSYCWGPAADFLKLTKNSLNSFVNGISVPTLPQNFKDAMVVLKKLHLRYIWIDALCIIQDSNEDWLAEAALMSKVYSYSFINLAATSSTNTVGGLFVEREPYTLNGCKVPVLWAGNVSKDYICIREDPWQDNVAHSPLIERAWVLQEKLLSSRTLHFARDQIYWECNELYASETYPAGSPWEHFSWQAEENKFKTAFGTFRKNQDLPESTAAAAAEVWANTVEEYCAAKLTRGTDKLIALSGVAQVISKSLRDPQYFAGHWRLNLATSLLWMTESPGNRSAEYIAPSWSWASMVGAIKTNRSDEDNVVLDIIDVKTHVVGDPYGSVDGGILRIRGRLCKATIKAKDSQFPDMPGFHLTFGASQASDFYVPCAVDDENDARRFAKEQEVFCLLFQEVEPRYVKARERVKNSEVLPISEGLLLEPTTERGQFRRVGHFQARYWDHYLQILDHLRDKSRLWNIPLGMRYAKGFNHYKLLREAFKSRNIGPEHYEDFDGVDRYVITIV